MINIMRAPNPCLSVACNEILDPNSKKVTECIKSLRKYLTVNKRVQGLAAPQIGYILSIMLVRYKDGVIRCCLNPIIEWKFGHKDSNEGCESVEGRYIVKRPLIMKVSYFDEQGKEVHEILTYRKARVFEHEYHHLCGILISDIGKRCE